MKNKSLNIKHTGGYSYTVSEEQFLAFQKWTIEERLNWIETTNQFLSAIQTPEEKERTIKLRRGEEI